MAAPPATADPAQPAAVEAARFPPSAVAKDGNRVADAVVTLERQGGRLLVRHRSPSGIPEGDPSAVDPRRTSAPIEVAIAAAAYDAFLRPDLVLRANSMSGDRSVNARVGWVRVLLSAPKLALVATQQAIDPGAYGVVQLAQDACLDSVEKILCATPDPRASAAAAALAAKVYSPGFIANQLATGAETVLPAYVRETLPLLKAKLDLAARDARDQTTRLHLRQSADRIDALLKR